MPSYTKSPTAVADGGQSFTPSLGAWTLGTPAIDGNYSTEPAGSGYARYLNFSTFGFTVPAGESGTQISVTLAGKQDVLNVNWFVTVLSATGGVIYNFPTIYPNNTSPAGFSTILTADIDAVLASEINGAGFTVRVSAYSASSANIGVDGVSVTITTSVTPYSKDLALSGVVGAGAAHGDVALSGVVIRESATDITLSGVVGLPLEITNPSEGESVTSAEVTFQWFLPLGPQSDYRLRVYADSGLNTLIYDSGVVGSALQQHVVPAGALPSPETLYATVRVTTASQGTGTSPTRTFATSFAASVNITGVDSRLIGGCAAPTLLPGIRISWNQITPGAGESFVSYDIRRRESGETLYTRVAQIQAIGTTHYDDYQVESRTAYEYMVVWQAQNGASTLISNNQSAPEVALNDFEFNWLHDPSDGFGVRIDGWAQNVGIDPDVRFVQPWGRTVPTAHWGTAFGHKFNLTLHPQLLKNRDFWRDLETLMSRKTALCLRFGRAGERYFVAIGRGQKQQAQAQFESSLELTEIYYDEAV